MNCKDCKNYEPIGFPIHSTLFGKPLEYWSDLERKYNRLVGENLNLQRLNENLQDRINNAIDYLKP